ASTGGRPPQRLALLPDARLVLAIDLGASHLRVALSDLSPTLVAQSQIPISFADGPVAILESALVLADELLASQQRTREDVIAIGMGVPGPVNFETGRPANPPIMPGWDGFDIPAWFQQHMDALVVVDNDVNLMAIGEKDQLETGSEDFIF